MVWRNKQSNVKRRDGSTVEQVIECRWESTLVEKHVPSPGDVYTTRAAIKASSKLEGSFYKSFWENGTHIEIGSALIYVDTERVVLPESDYTPGKKRSKMLDKFVSQTGQPVWVDVVHRMDYMVFMRAG